MAEQDAAAALRVLEEADVPAAESATIADIFADPHYAARGAIVTAEDPALGRVRMQGVTPRLSETPGAVRRGAPLLGEHNAAVYGELGLEESELARLAEQGVI
jgi:crotonobetainyl-CoA:carnitine CoA-transferase CaiB-like acyl-CoA transferase